MLLSSTVATNNFLFTADLANLDVFSDGVWQSIVERFTWCAPDFYGVIRALRNSCS